MTPPISECPISDCPISETCNAQEYGLPSVPRPGTPFPDSLWLRSSPSLRAGREGGDEREERGGWSPAERSAREGYLVDPTSERMLLSRAKPCTRESKWRASAQPVCEWLIRPVTISAGSVRIPPWWGREFVRAEPAGERSAVSASGGKDPALLPGLLGTPSFSETVG